jgi:hypothetical protein
MTRVSIIHSTDLSIRVLSICRLSLARENIFEQSTERAGLIKATVNYVDRQNLIQLRLTHYSHTRAIIEINSF